MKNNKVKAKKGMTLIEVIISVALLSILLIPMSNLVLEGFKESKISENKQNATYIGQKILEEVKSYDEIRLKEEDGRRYFELLDGYKIYKSSDENTFEETFNTGIYGSENIEENKKKYNVKVTIKEDKEFNTYTDIDNPEENKYEAFTLKFTENAGRKIVTLEEEKSQIKEFSGDIIIKLEKDNSLKIIDKENKNEIINYKDTPKLNNKIVLFFDESYKVDNNIELENNLNDIGEVYIIKDGDTEEYNVLITKGNFIVNGPINRIEKNMNGNRFNYEVEVKNNIGTILFKGSSSKNIIIK